MVRYSVRKLSLLLYESKWVGLGIFAFMVQILDVLPLRMLVVEIFFFRRVRNAKWFAQISHTNSSELMVAV